MYKFYKKELIIGIITSCNLKAYKNYIMSCCPKVAWGELKNPNYQEKGKVEKVILYKCNLQRLEYWLLLRIFFISRLEIWISIMLVKVQNVSFGTTTFLALVEGVQDKHVICSQMLVWNLTYYKSFFKFDYVYIFFIYIII